MPACQHAVSGEGRLWGTFNREGMQDAGRTYKVSLALVLNRNWGEAGEGKGR